MIIQRQVWEGRQTKYRQKKRSGEERSQRAENWWTQTWIALVGFCRGWKSIKLRSVQGTNLLECLESSFMQTWPQSGGEWWVLIFERMAEWKTEKRSDLVGKDNWRSQRSSAHSLFWEQSSLRIREKERKAIRQNATKLQQETRKWAFWKEHGRLWSNIQWGQNT